MDITTNGWAINGQSAWVYEIEKIMTHSKEFAREQKNKFIQATLYDISDVVGDFNFNFWHIFLHESKVQSERI